MKIKRNNCSNSLIFFFVPPLLLSFILVIVIPLITFSDFFSQHENITLVEFIHKDLFTSIDDLNNLENYDELIKEINNIEIKKNVIIIKDDNPIFYSNEILNSPTNSISKKITLLNGETYIVDIAFSLFSKKTIIFGLIIRYLLLFICILSIYSINRVRKHINNLKKATDNIASGDYDTPIRKSKKDSFVFLDNSLENMRIQIKEDRHQLSRFFAGVSHDLKTPLASIIGYTQALEDNLAQSKEEEKTYLNIIHDKSQILEDRISSLINYIKISDQGFKTDLIEQELYPYLDNLCNQTSIELSLKDIVFEWDLKFNKGYMCKFDKVLISRAIENLIDNAIKYGDITKPLKLLATQSYDGIFISLINYNKKELSKETISHLFEPFYRGDNSRKGKGFGLGLASVKSIISSHGWKVESKLDTDNNTIIFTINIPNY